MGRRILVIDDDDDVLGVLRGFLGEGGFQVQTAPSGAAGLEKAIAQVPDLILLDLKIPDINGMEVYRRLQAEPVTAGVPVIIITAVQEEQLMESARMLGVRRYITKPFVTEDLLKLVEETLNEGA